MSLFIITYHYVRPLKNSKYPNLKALELNKFKKQINILKKNTIILKMENLNQVNLNKNKKFSLLTFDDGYVDHYKYVYPILKKHKISGSFFIPIKNFISKDVLLVNKIHFILEKFYQKEQKLEELINQYLTKKKINLHIVKKKWIQSRAKRRKRNFDNQKVFFIKDLLQNILSDKIRNNLVNYLFAKYISKNSKDFHRKLYMNEKQIKILKKNGMHIGSHGYEHQWYEFMNFKNQRKDIKKSFKILKEKNISSNLKTFCYAYGSHNKNSIKILKNEKIDYAFTTLKGTEKNINFRNKLKLKRFDTNDVKNLNFN
jgi:peptidoglycan/xylan/chitin deacetylase (PgdA/CDA1 family)